MVSMHEDCASSQMGQLLWSFLSFWSCPAVLYWDRLHRLLLFATPDCPWGKHLGLTKVFSVRVRREHSLLCLCIVVVWQSWEVEWTRLCSPAVYLSPREIFSELWWREVERIEAQERKNPLTWISLDTRWLSTTVRGFKRGYVAKQ